MVDQCGMTEIRNVLDVTLSRCNFPLNSIDSLLIQLIKFSKAERDAERRSRYIWIHLKAYQFLANKRDTKRQDVPNNITIVLELIKSCP